MCVCVCVCWLSFLCLLPHNHKVVAKTLDIMPSRREKKKRRRRRSRVKGPWFQLSLFLSEKKIIRILKANKYTKFFVDIYSKDNQPNETEFINGWLTDKLIRINYNQYEKENHQMLVNTMKCLKILNEEVDYLLKKQQEEGENSGTKNEEEGN